MTRQIINIGTGPDSYTGDNLRTAFTKVNDNFAQLYVGNVGANTSINVLTANTVSTNGNVNAGNVLVQYQVIASGNISAPIFIGNGRYLTGVTVSANTGNIAFSNLTISGSVAGNIVLDPAGDGNVSIVSDVIPGANVTYNLGSSTRQWKDLWLSNSTLYLGGFPVTVSNTGALSVNGSPVSSSYGDANVTVFLPTYSGLLGGTLSTVSQPNITAVGTLTSLTATNDITTTSGRFIGNGSSLTAITGANVNGTVANATYAVTAQFVTGLTGANVTTALGYVPLNSNSANTYSNTNVASYLPTYSGNIAGNISKNGNVWTFGTDGNLALPHSGVLLVSGGITAGPTIASPAPYLSGFSSISAISMSASGNITGNYILGNGSQLTGLGLTSTNVAIGYGAGATSQGGTTVAVGAFAGQTTQGESAVAIGFNAGQTTQGIKSVAIGMTSGYSLQGNGAVAIGDSAGYTNQGTQAIAIGRFAGLTNQANNTIILNATGANLNATTANTLTVAPIRNDVANVAEILFYNTTSKEVTYGNTISVAGNISGNYILGNGSQLTGMGATYSNANVANYLPTYSGNISSGNISTGRITLTNGAVINDTAGESVAFGQNAGNTSQGSQAVAIGQNAGANSQAAGAVAVGVSAGQLGQGITGIAIGDSAGSSNQGPGGVAIGAAAGFDSQGQYSVAMGYYAGNSSQGNTSVAIGNESGRTTQGIGAVAVGTYAGFNTQGANAVAIGSNAGTLNQANNSIIINATGNALEQTIVNTFTVAPVRNDVANIGEVVFYNTTSKEVTYGNTISVAGNISAGNLNVTGNIVDTGAISIITGSNGNIALAPNGTGIVTASGAFTAVGNITGGNIITAGNITGNTGGFAIGYRDIPQVVFTSNATLALTDAGKHYFSSNSANVITVPNNTTVSFNIGTAISIVQQGTANLTVTPGSGVTMYLAGNSTSSARILGNYGMATLMKVGTDTWFINGTGVA